MAMCKYCGKAFAWGQEADGHFVPLVPKGEDSGLMLTFQDENGDMRADHRTVCINRGGPTVRISRLARPVKSEEQPEPLPAVQWSEPDEHGEVHPLTESAT